MNNKSSNIPQRKTTLKWNINGELSSIDMTRIINYLSIKELKECELACDRFNNKKILNFEYGGNKLYCYLKKILNCV